MENSQFIQAELVAISALAMEKVDKRRSTRRRSQQRHMAVASREYGDGVNHHTRNDRAMEGTVVANRRSRLSRQCATLLCRKRGVVVSNGSSIKRNGMPHRACVAAFSSPPQRAVCRLPLSAP